MRQYYPIYMFILILTVVEGGVNAILSPFLQSLSFSLMAIGYLSSMMSFSRLLSRLPAGVLYGLTERRAFFFIFLLLFGLSTLALGFSSSKLVLGIVIIIHGFSFGLVTTVLLALSLELKAQRHGETVGWYMAFNSAGYALGNFFSGLLADYLGFKQSFLIMGMITGLTLLLQNKLSWPAAGEEQDCKPEEIKKGGFGRIKPPGLSELAQLPKSVALAALLGFFINALNDIMNTFFPLLALQKGISLSHIGFLKGIKSTSATLIRISLGLLLKWVNFRLLNNMAFFILCIGVVLLPASASILILSVIFTVTGLGRGIIRTTSAIFMAEPDFKDIRFKGMASAVYNSGLDLGSVMGPVLGGLVGHVSGVKSIFQIFPVLFLMLYFLLTKK